MSLNIRSERVNALAETLAARQHVTRTDAVTQALENELRRLDRPLPLRERLRPLQARCGKGSGHPDQLDLGAGFACATAKAHRTKVLFKGDDFDETDIRSAAT